MMKLKVSAETIEKALKHTRTLCSNSVKGAIDVSLIPFLSSPFDQNELKQALKSTDSGMALLDATGLQADTLLYAEERFFSLYEKSVETANGGQLFLLCPYFSPQESVSFGASQQVSATRELLLSQLCAALRVSTKGQVSLVLPFVSTLQEIEATRRLVEQAMRELTARKIPFDETVSLGILLATPTALLLSRQLIEAVDFVMIDTDFLAQLSLISAPVSEYFDKSLSENAQAALYLAEIGIGNAHVLGRFVMIGGSLALDPRFLPHFLAMGASGLIVPMPKLKQVKKILRASHKNITQNSR